eukprot:8175158-Lingulodinium_polyedra.AAC.1
MQLAQAWDAKARAVQEATLDIQRFIVAALLRTKHHARAMRAIGPSLEVRQQCSVPVLEAEGQQGPSRRGLLARGAAQLVVQCSDELLVRWLAAIRWWPATSGSYM